MAHLAERFALSKLFRPHCSECGSPMLAWFLGEQAARFLGPVRADELVGTLVPRQRRDAECWLCRTCGACGLTDVQIEWYG